MTTCGRLGSQDGACKEKAEEKKRKRSLSSAGCERKILGLSEEDVKYWGSESSEEEGRASKSNSNTRSRSCASLGSVVGLEKPLGPK